MDERHQLPDTDRIGVLTSTILLALALMRIVRTPEFNLEMQLPGFFLSLPLDLASLMSVLTAGLTATGMDWLLRGHPNLNGRATYQWWILPTLTTFVVSVTLSLLPNGAAWQTGFAVSGIFLFLVFLAEYVVVDPGARYYAVALAGLTAISYTLFFVLAMALRYGDLRLFLTLPALFLSAGLASLRVLHLRLNRWEYAWSIGIAFVCVQAAAGLHYLPLASIQFGLMLVGPLYGLTNLAVNLSEDLPTRHAVFEPVIATVLCWGLALVLR
ncbi:MAG: hypothetical protein IT314_12625 [Anaerolineales bacterium]|nr:hypothetical protein [Anaerolineales bacterium]